MKATGFKPGYYDPKTIQFDDGLDDSIKPIKPKRSGDIDDESFTYERTRLGRVKAIPTARTMMKRLGVK